MLACSSDTTHPPGSIPPINPAQVRLRAEGKDVEESPISACGIRVLTHRFDVMQHPLYAEGQRERSVKIQLKKKTDFEN